jgi:hypothetical protein
MDGIAFAISSGDLESELAKSFVESVDWPIDSASLAALTDLGLSEHQIAQYFSVTLLEVRRLKSVAYSENALLD